MEEAEEGAKEGVLVGDNGENSDGGGEEMGRRGTPEVVRSPVKSRRSVEIRFPVAAVVAAADEPTGEGIAVAAVGVMAVEGAATDCFCCCCFCCGGCSCSGDGEGRRKCGDTGDMIGLSGGGLVTGAVILAAFAPGTATGANGCSEGGSGGDSEGDSVGESSDTVRSTDVIDAAVAAAERGTDNWGRCLFCGGSCGARVVEGIALEGEGLLEDW